MRHTYILAILFSVTAAPALACLPQQEATIFHGNITPPAEAEFITGVVIETVKNQDAIAVISTVTKAPPNTIKTGDRVKLEFVTTGCGPNLRAMDSGVIAAQQSLTPNKLTVLRPFIYSADGVLMGVAK